MSEYEASALVYMHAERLSNLASHMQANASIMQTEVTLSISLLSGYLLVAYLLGANLTKVQVTILNVLYFLAATVSAFAILRGYLTGQTLFNRYQEIAGEAQKLTALPGESTIYLVHAALAILVIVLPFYFMWTVRHPKAP